MCAYPSMTAHCTLHFYYLHFHHCHKTLHLFICHDCRHPNCAGTIYIKSPRTPNLFLGIYPKEIIGQVPKRRMYVRGCLLLCSPQKQKIANASISVSLSAKLDCKILFTPVTITSCHLMPGVNYIWLLAKGLLWSWVAWKTESHCGTLRQKFQVPVLLMSHSSLKGRET